jgi:hypothetical protein
MLSFSPCNRALFAQGRAIARPESGSNKQ